MYICIYIYVCVYVCIYNYFIYYRRRMFDLLRDQLENNLESSILICISSMLLVTHIHIIQYID